MIDPQGVRENDVMQRSRLTREKDEKPQCKNATVT
jgi:hypothetical protein